MALIDHQTTFDLNLIDNQIVGIAAQVGRHDSGLHKHNKDQLLYAPFGCMNITLDSQKLLLPPTRAAWIPANTIHCAKMTNVVEYRSIYFDTALTQNLKLSLKTVEVNPLLQALIERMAFWSWEKPFVEMTNTYRLFLDELVEAKEQTLALPLPQDRRLQLWLEKLNQHDQPIDNLAQLSLKIGASSKTISRIFSNETGMSFQEWRQQWRLIQAIEKLTAGYQVNDVAYQLGFSSDSAFIAFFKQQTGTTPLKYLS
ncbi:TPA: AraC family transcriptional regulator [Photobacterium damselae]|uniref:AraC family transcriptional regulator n=1 Tax=Photobacterium damselae TaxID=38293 RepID=UPI00083B8CC1|nr:helix-turn-helix transcriptional regulator [Photobacterium damselae]KAB1176454.1 helix-turn-helix transcriptional regulator [Photobacterium damselae subsp. damselae]MBF7098988.1 helix-turn-helix transcriptional regulator [Photobacterium damselae]QSH59416.1 helix-turn-helix transcriptional regulator [Photobacterium damselae subsp. damselae]